MPWRAESRPVSGFFRADVTAQMAAALVRPAKPTLQEGGAA